MADNSIKYVLKLVDEMTAPLKAAMGFAKKQSAEMDKNASAVMKSKKEKLMEELSLAKDAQKAARIQAQIDKLAKNEQSRIARDEAKKIRQQNADIRKLEREKKDAAKAELKRVAQDNMISKKRATWWKRNTELGSALTNVFPILGAGVVIGTIMAVRGLLNLAKSLVTASMAAADVNVKLEAQVGLFAKNSTAAKKHVDQMREWASNSGVGLDVMSKWSQRLSILRVDEQKRAETMAAMSDLQAMGLNADALMSMHEKMREAQLTGNPMANWIQGTTAIDLFAAMGLDPQDLADQAGVSMAEFRRSQMTYAQLIERSKQAITARTGKDLGGFSSEMATTESAWRKLGDSWNTLIANADWSEVQKGLADVIDAMKDPNTVQLFTDALFALSKAAGWAVRAAFALSVGAAGAIKYFADLCEWAGIGPMDMFLGGLTMGLIPLEKVLMKGLWQLLDNALSWFDLAMPNFTEIGTNLIAGLWKGIKSAWGLVTDGLKGLTEQLPKGVRKVLGIESPSKVFAKIGGYTAEGFGVGFEAKMGEVSEAIRGAVSPPSVSSNKSSSVSQSNSFSFTNQGGGEPDFEAFRRMFLRITQDALVEMGGAA